MPSIKTALKAIVGRTVATEHATLLAAITDHEQRRQEVPGIKARISDCRERIRGNESRQVKLNSALRGYQEDPKKWASHDRDTRAELAELRREISAMSDKIVADEQTLSEIASATLPEVTPDLMRFHQERVSEAQASVSRIQNALESARGELSALEAASDPVIDLRRQLADTLAMQALGSASAEDVSAIEGKIAASENVASATSSKAKRLASTITGLEQRLTQAQADLDRLTSATPTLQAECLAPEIAKAETRYRDALAAMVQASDGYRALAHILTTIRPEATPAPLPEVIASLKDPGQLRLAQAIEREQARLSAMGI